MKLNKISLKDKTLFKRYLSLGRHQLSVYAFENIYIWKRLFDIEWLIIQESLCVFFKDRFGSFLYLEPLAAQRSPAAIEEVFKILDKLNKNKEVSRIENVEEKDFYQNLGYECREKFCDYVCLREELAYLAGGRFKSKRASRNYFVKHYDALCLPLSVRYKDGCLKLYKQWAEERRLKNEDVLYQGMLGDSQDSLRAALDSYPDLAFKGIAVRIRGQIKAFTFGFELAKDTFCILYEIADLSVKGLAQFIFAEFCSGLKGYKYINIMDDSGLENLKEVKLSYHPDRLIPGYIVKNRKGDR